MSTAFEDEELPDIDPVPCWNSEAGTSNANVVKAGDKQAGGTSDLNTEENDDDGRKTDNSSTESSSETENEMRNLAEYEAIEANQSRSPPDGLTFSTKQEAEDIGQSNSSNAVKDNDGFLPPPPASTLLIRRTRTSSTGAPTYVVSSINPPSESRLDMMQSGSGFMEGDGDKQLLSHGEGHPNGGKGKLIRKPGRPFGSLGRKSLLTGIIKRGPGRPPLSSSTSGLARKKYKRRGRRWSFPFHRHNKPPRGPLKPGNRHAADEIEEEFDGDGRRRRKSLTWRPIDDFRLIVNTLQTHDLKQVHMGVRFSCRYTLEEVRNRWRTLLYNDLVSKVALIACRNLHSKVKMSVYANALFSQKELLVLQSVRSNSNPTLSTFQSLLRAHILTFHHARTARSLQQCWMELKDLHLLDDQNVKTYFESGRENFSDFESSVDDAALLNFHIDPVILNEILVQERKNKKRIRVLEQEVATWQVLSDLVLEGQVVKPAESDDTTYALIRGKNVRFIMAAKEITLGRRTNDNWVDADLSEEGWDTKISRRQAIIKMRALGDFVILNQGRHPMYIDGKVLLPGEVTALQDQSVIRVSQLNFVFIVNDRLLKEQQLKVIDEESNAEHVDIEALTQKLESKVPKTLFLGVPEVEPSVSSNSSGPTVKTIKADLQMNAGSSPRKRKSSNTFSTPAYSAASPPTVLETTRNTLLQDMESPPLKKPVKRPRKPKIDKNQGGSTLAPSSHVTSALSVGVSSNSTVQVPGFNSAENALPSFSSVSSAIKGTRAPTSPGSYNSSSLTPAGHTQQGSPGTSIMAPNSASAITALPSLAPVQSLVQPTSRSTVPLPSFSTLRTYSLTLPAANTTYYSPSSYFSSAANPTVTTTLGSDINAFPKLSEILSKPPGTAVTYVAGNAQVTAPSPHQQPTDSLSSTEPKL